MKKRNCPVVRVDWHDAHSSGSWDDGKTIPNSWPCTTVGFLVRKDKSEILVAQSMSHPDGGYGQFMGIPVSLIKRIKRLKE